MTGVAEPIDGRRAIAERNAAAIRDAAIRVLGRDRNAGMAAIAAEAGVGRATLYRHHPTREHLVEALRDDLRARAAAVMREARRAEGEPIEVLRRFVAALWDLRDAYAVIETAPSAAKERRAQEFWRPMLRVIARAQKAGSIDPALPAEWVLAALQGLLRASVQEVDAGRMSREDAVDLAMRTFLSGASPRAR